jgi:clan AA aspartic protease
MPSGSAGGFGMILQPIEPKPGAATGRVIVGVIVENVEDLRRAQRGEITSEQVRRMTVPALVDSGATFFCMPEKLVQQLGLPFNRERDTRTVTDPLTLKVYGGARLTVQGRECDEEVLAMPDGGQVLLGQIPLEKMDWSIDPNNRRLVGNPEHGGQWIAGAF